jgi:hypothetical protein
MQGQINLDSSFGKLIFMLARQQKTIVEIGTWNGLGSTRCIIEALKSRQDDYEFYTIECQQERFQFSWDYWQSVLTLDQKSRIHLLHGSILLPHQVPSKASLANVDGFVEQWYDEDVTAISTSNYLLDLLPAAIDMLLLDGGEYTTYAEWQVLKDRTKIILLDDTACLKCAAVRQELLADPMYITVADNLTDRNGYAIFRNITKS